MNAVHKSTIEFETGARVRAERFIVGLSFFVCFAFSLSFVLHSQASNALKMEINLNSFSFLTYSTISHTSEPNDDEV